MLRWDLVGLLCEFATLNAKNADVDCVLTDEIMYTISLILNFAGEFWVCPLQKPGQLSRRSERALQKSHQRLPPKSSIGGNQERLVQADGAPIHVF